MADRKMKKTKWAEVTCKKHGSKMSGNNWKDEFPQVKVPLPATRNQRRAGCPACKQEKGKEVQ